MDAVAWNELVGASPPADCVAGVTLDRVGAMGPALEEVVQLDGHMAQLDHDIQNFEFVPNDSTTPDQFAHGAAQTTSLRLRWGAFYPEWRAWRDAHQSSFSRLSGASGIEFGTWRVRYNQFRQELIDIGGKASAPAEDTNDPGGEPGKKSPLEQLVDLLDSAKWLVAVGLGAYILVGSGAVAALTKKL